MKDDLTSPNAHIEHQKSLGEKDMTGDGLEAIARDGNELEHVMTTLETVKAYPMAIFWCVMVSMCVVMEGYDTILIGNFYAYPTFAKKYGQVQDVNGNWQLTAAWVCRARREADSWTQVC